MAVVLFDGVCNLCNGSVRFIIERDPRARFQFAPLQSPVADRLIGAHVDRASLPDSVVLVDDGRLYVRSSAALRIARGLRFPWPLAWVFIVVPRPIRDWVYDLIARHRYAWFGKRDECMVPTSQIKDRFLSI
ncbi:MAG: thiol-disulfide oxidoreductase DCC family protein [Acidobacteriota bacterium]